MAPQQPHLIQDCHDPGSSSCREVERINRSPAGPSVLIGRSISVRDERTTRPVSPLCMMPFEQETVVTDASVQARVVELNAQQGFLLFVKVYSLYLCQQLQDEKKNGKQLLGKFKATVSKCTLENRKGNPDYMPLQTVVETKLRTALGDEHWTAAMHIFHIYCRQRRIRVDSLFSSS